MSDVGIIGVDRDGLRHSGELLLEPRAYGYDMDDFGGVDFATMDLGMGSLFGGELIDSGGLAQGVGLIDSGSRATEADGAALGVLDSPSTETVSSPTSAPESPVEVRTVPVVVPAPAVGAELHKAKRERSSSSESSGKEKKARRGNDELSGELVGLISDDELVGMAPAEVKELGKQRLGRPLTKGEGEELLHVRRMVRNRRSAQISRNRKKADQSRAQRELAALREERAKLQQENGSLREEVSYLTKLIRDSPHIPNEVLSRVTASASLPSTSRMAGMALFMFMFSFGLYFQLMQGATPAHMGAGGSMSFPGSEFGAAAGLGGAHLLKSVAADAAAAHVADEEYATVQKGRRGNAPLVGEAAPVVCGGAPKGTIRPGSLATFVVPTSATNLASPMEFAQVRCQVQSVVGKAA